MNLNNNHIFSILNKIKWNFHLVFTYPFEFQRRNTFEAINLRLSRFYVFISRISGTLKFRRRQQIYAYSDEISDSGSGHLHALYKLPEKYQGNDQEFISNAERMWPAAIGISPHLAKAKNPLFISPITAESYQSKVNYVAEIIAKTDSATFLSPEATRFIQKCNTFHDSQYGGDVSRRQS